MVAPLTPCWRRRAGLAAFALALPAAAPPLSAQWSGTYESSYLPGSFNWEFRRQFPRADRLFNAFDYGHAILYETLWHAPASPASRLEREEYDFITTRLLPNPPRLPLVEAAIEVNYARLAPEAKAMFDWAHLLHRQIYDVWADSALAPAEKDARVTELVAYYRTRPELAFSGRPKSMDAMDGQPFSLAFRRRYPKFNGLIWAYHWLQVGLYEPLLTGATQAQRQTLVDATLGRFRQMLGNPPETMPYLMPMTSAIAPTFARRYPEAAAIFDNLHMMHDVVSDILTSTEIPRSAKRQEILDAAAMFRSDSAYGIGLEEWLRMGETMGLENMGGPAVGFGAELPRPTVQRGASMAGMMHGGNAMSGSMSGGMHGGMAGMPDGKAGGKPGGMAGMHGGEGMAGMPGMPGMSAMSGMQHGMSRTAMPMSQRSAADERTLLAILQRMLADPVIRERAATDPALQQMLNAVPALGGGTGAPSGMAMPGMAMPGMAMPGMAMPGMAMPGMAMPGMAMPGTRARAGRASASPRAGMGHEGMGAMAGGSHEGMTSMPGMRPDGMAGMPEMNAAASREERRQAEEFLVRLFDDPLVQAQLRSDPALQRLWSDPAVQRRWRELRRQQGDSTRRAPVIAPADSGTVRTPAPVHQHP